MPVWVAEEFLDPALKEIEHLRTLPEIITLCGSTRFPDAFTEANRFFTLQGIIVLGVGHYGNSIHLERAITARQKDIIDALHFRKIDLSTRVHILNVGGYIGRSTHNEVLYAVRHGKMLSFLEDKIRPWDTTADRLISTYHYVNAIKTRLALEAGTGE
jgi:hypothetical protein